MYYDLDLSVINLTYLLKDITFSRAYSAFNRLIILITKNRIVFINQVKEQILYLKGTVRRMHNIKLPSI